MAQHDERSGASSSGADSAPLEDAEALDAPVDPPPSTRPPLRRLLAPLAFAVALVLVGWIVLSGVEGLVRSGSLERRIAETQTEIDDLRRDADQLAALIAWLESDEYVERTAREDLGLVRPGEEAFAVHAPQRSGLAIQRSPWWANLLPKHAQD